MLPRKLTSYMRKLNNAFEKKYVNKVKPSRVSSDSCEALFRMIFYLILLWEKNTSSSKLYKCISNGRSWELIFGGACYQKEFCVSEWVGLKHFETANGNSPWAYIRKGLISEGYLRLRFGRLTIREGLFLFIYLFIYLFIFFFFWGGGAYYRNFTVYCIILSK